MKLKKIVSCTSVAAMILVSAGLTPAVSQQQQFPPGPVITIQLANIDELCTAANFQSFNSHREYIRALTLNIRLLPGEDKRQLILKCAEDLEIATQQGRIPDSLNRLALGWVLMSCLTLFDLGFVDTRTCAEVRAIRDRNHLVR